MARHVALLRGINVGGANKLPMADLRALLEGLGYADVETLGASGNALFAAARETPARAAERIEAALAERMGKPMPVVVRSGAQMRKVAQADVFPRKPGEDARLAVTFLRQPSRAPLPDVPGIAVAKRTAGELYTVWTSVRGRPPAFTRHEKALGVATTTRFWNVVQDLAQRAA